MLMLTIPGLQIILRDWRVDDLETHAYWLMPGHRWQELDAPYFPGPTEDEIPDIIARHRMHIEEKHVSNPRASLAIAHAETDALLGLVNWYWESVETVWPMMGIVIYDPDNWRKGYGYEALGLWTEYLFAEVQEAVRLDLRTWSGNTGMMGLAQRLGFLEEARFRKARIVNGVHYDALGYGVLRDEWEALYPGGFAVQLREG